MKHLFRNLFTGALCIAMAIACTKKEEQELIDITKTLEGTRWLTTEVKDNGATLEFSLSFDKTTVVLEESLKNSKMSVRGTYEYKDPVVSITFAYGDEKPQTVSGERDGDKLTIEDIVFVRQ